MDQYDIFYKTLVDMKKATKDNKDIVNLVDQIQKSNQDKEQIEVLKKIVTIDTDWIKAIEDGLPAIEKAIGEERQFIRSNGEVVDISKVKQVSPESVRHLAQHSNLITREPVEGEDIIPDQIYTVERMSDYTVYENRFLYLALITIRNFISLRLEKILEFSNTYNGTLTINKQVKVVNRTLEVELKLHDTKKDDEFLKLHNESQDAIERIQDLVKAMNVYLSRPLMETVSKSPMLKPPITKTNVLKMNINFKRVLSLYDFVMSYDKKGYEIEEQTIHISPFQGETSLNYGNLIALTAFTTYMHGNRLEAYLKESYQKEEEARKQADIEHRLAQIQKLKKRLAKEEIDPFEYMASLESINRTLEKEHDELIEGRKEIVRLTERIEFHKKEIAALNEEIIDLNQQLESTIAEYEAKLEEQKQAFLAEIESLNQKHALEIQSLNEDFQREKEELNERFRNEKDALCAEYEDKIAVIQAKIQETEEKCTNRITELTSDYEARMEALKQENETLVAKEKEHIEIEAGKIEQSYQVKFQAMEDDNSKLQKEIDALKEKISKLEGEKQELTDSNTALSARVHSLMAMNNVEADKSYISQEDFLTLEKEFEYYKKFFKKQWKQAKKQIREDVKNQVRNDMNKPSLGNGVEVKHDEE